MSVTIYHNPKCGTSRNTLALIKNAGIEPEVILYLETPPSKEQLRELIAKMGVSVRSVIRTNVPPYEELGLAADSFSDEALLEAMIAHPILINRPIVVTELGVKLCRPSELVLDILAQPQLAPFSKENGEVIIDANLKRVK